MTVLSVIIPIYNKAPFLRRCLDSCVKQVSNEVEFILVDDGSTDGCKDIIKEYDDPRFRVFRKRNGGVSSARNYGIEKAKGKYITFLDADDEYPAGAVKTMISHCGQHQEKITEYNHKRQYGITPPKLVRVVNSGVFNFTMRQTCWWGVWNKVFEREFLIENNIRFDEQCNYGEDEVFVLECLIRNNAYRHIFAVTLIRHFDDKNSLVHLLNHEGVLEQWQAEQRILERLEDPVWKRRVKSLIEEHENSIIYKRRLGGLTPQRFISAVSK